MVAIGASINQFIASPITWIAATMIFVILFAVLLIILIMLARKTHAIDEFKAWMGGKPIALFFMENRYVDWKPVAPDCGIIQDKNYGAFIINERATYVDKKTKNIIIPFDAQFGASINVHAAKLADDLQYIVKDDEELKKLRFAIAHNMIDDNETILALKTSIHFGAIKTMMTALIPHNINSKIEKIIASRLKNFGNVNVPQVALLFAAVLGAMLMGYLIIRLVAK
jgi:hypothetical protein